MLDENLARLRAHRNYIYRCRRLPAPQLTDLEWQYLERRLNAEQAALNSVSGAVFPVTLPERRSSIAA